MSDTAASHKRKKAADVEEELWQALGGLKGFEARMEQAMPMQEEKVRLQEVLAFLQSAHESLSEAQAEIANHSAVLTDCWCSIKQAAVQIEMILAEQKES